MKKGLKNRLKQLSWKIEHTTSAAERIRLMKTHDKLLNLANSILKVEEIIYRRTENYERTNR